MNVEQLLLQKWRSLSKDKQQEVIDFVEFLELKKTTATGQQAAPETKAPLGDRLRQIREEIVASGEPLLDWEGIEREKAKQRG
ncbi:DUF2281 domain-containing protein [Chroococcidiopsis sp. FACHB-1243]|uniref:DUF2281 domain-containing protein n=1 Tax=Chroococcidiopsis sp. [FACHB-1243] TaxID=2692781 RepID=UPI0017877288|nr:DUF2281 domain-containing protein [Chroococcidiopsis sp. [FACHB-1243]]MBD2308697.1 DUF2281 domain-containing protein [Chroococcidiopsis sp. [FACHB-1243]]